MINPIKYMSDEDYNKSSAKYNRSGLSTPIIYLDETWREVNEYITSVEKGIFISNLGTVYDDRLETKKRHRPSSNGYPIVSLPSSDPNKKYENYLIHRLVGSVFVDNPNPNEFNIINHKDGIKFHCYEENLEWTDYTGNAIHAYDTKLRVSGENHPWAILSEEQVRLICEGLVKRMRFDDICTELLNIEFNDKMKGIITLIRKGKIWRSISSQYTIPEAKRNTSFFTDTQIHEICKMLEQKKDNYEILNRLGYDITKFNQTEKQNVFEIIARIRRKTRFTRISENYNF